MTPGRAILRLRHTVEAPGTPGVTTTEPPHREDQTPEWTVGPNRAERVRRAAGVVPAPRGAQHGGAPPEMHREQDHRTEPPSPARWLRAG